MHPVLFTVGDVTVRSHDFFVLLGVAVASLIFFREVRQRRCWDERLWTVVALTLVGGALGMRASGFVRHLDLSDNPGLVDAWRYGAKSILGGLTGAYLGALLGKRISGYTSRTGDLFAPAVALGMAVGRVGCFLTEAPGRATSLPWAVHVSPAEASAMPFCPACSAGLGMHPSFLYEIGFHLLSFVALRRMRHRIDAPGELLTLWLAAYAVFRFLVEFVRANETVWLGLTRPQWFLLPGVVLLALHLRRQHARGVYAGLLSAPARRSLQVPA